MGQPAPRSGLPSTTPEFMTRFMRSSSDREDSHTSLAVPIRTAMRATGTTTSTRHAGESTTDSYIYRAFGLVESQADVVGMSPIFVECHGQISLQALRSSFGGRPHEEEFQSAVHNRAAGCGNSRGFGQLLDAREAELHGTGGE